MTPEQREQFAKAQETGFKITGAVALAFVPGPEDLVLGAFLANTALRTTLRLFATKVDDLIAGSKFLKADKSVQLGRVGDFGTANKEFDKLTRGVKVKDQGHGIRSATLPDGTKVSVRPPEKSSGGTPTIQINREKEKPVKIRYFETR